MRRWKTVLAVSLAAAGLAFPTGAMASSHHSFFVKGVGTGFWVQGQSFSLTENLFMHHHKVGNDSIACRYLISEGNSFCHATFNLPGGAIFVDGWNGLTQTFQIPIVNGTGEFTNAHGTLTVTGTNVGDNYKFSFNT